MKRSVLGNTALGIVLFTVAYLIPQTTWACGGTFRPVCGRTAWLAKFVSSSIVLPGSGAAITVPIGLIPYALWSPTSTCAQPASPTTLELTLTCTAAGGGTPIIIGPTAVPTAVPTVPGPQPVSTGAGGGPVLGGPFLFPISGGTLPVGASYSCLIEGSYSINFTGGTGAGGNATGSGIMTGVGDTEVCIVEEAQGFPGTPRLDFQHVVPVDGPPIFARRGDQSHDTYRTINNDPNEEVTLTFNSTTNQVARMPQGANAGGTFFALSDPIPGTDNFIQSLAQDLPPGGLIPLPDPRDPNPGLVFDRNLGPHDIQFFEVITRTHGMCADGSCSEALVKGTGTFSNGDPALGCAGTAIVVDNVLASSHQCELTDTLQTGNSVDSLWSPARFNNDPHMTTHFAGNLDPLIHGSQGVQTTGPGPAGQFGIIGFPPTATDYLRTEIAPNSVDFSLDGFDQAIGFAHQRMDVNINNLGSGDSTITVPLIALDGIASMLHIDLDAGTGQVIVRDQMSDETMYSGSFTEFVNSPPAGISVDQTTYRKITKTGIPSQPLLGTEPLSYASLHAPTHPLQMVYIKVSDPRNGQRLAWQATSDNPDVKLISTSGNAGQDIVVIFDPAEIASAPDVSIGLVEVSNPEALNDPVFFPIAVRNSPTRECMDNACRFCKRLGLRPRELISQDNSFTPQTWDDAGNRANFFNRNATNGGTNQQLIDRYCGLE